MNQSAPQRVSELPWLSGAAERARQWLQGERAPHALLLTGPGGLGLPLLAQELAAIALGSALQNHPDLMQVDLLEDSSELRIDQIRELVEQLSLTSHAGGRKVAQERHQLNP